MGSDDGDNVITITLVDGGLGDEDGTANGVIVDQGGPGIIPKPDLVIEEIWTRERRDRCKVGFVVRNIGTVTVPCCHYATLFVNGEPVEEKHVRKALRPGRSYKGYFITTVSCTDVIRVCADNFDAVDESDETNNCLPPIEKKPDLVIEDKWEEWVNETHYTVTYVIHNNGTAPAPACHNTTLIVDGIAIEHKHVPVDLAPCETYTDTFDTVIECTGDSDTIKVCADNNETVDELDETNNCLENEWTCEVVEKPDLVIEDKWEEWVNGNNYIVTYVIHNQGTAIAPAGHNTTLIVDGVAIEHKHVPDDLEYCETYTDTFDTVIECTGDSDTIKVCADNNETVDELDETNNCLENEWTCEVVKKPDLVIEDKWEEWVNGNNYIVTYVIHNNGTAPAPAGHNTTLYVDGVAIEHKHVPVDLEPCETYTDTFDTVIECTDDSDIIMVCADNNEIIDELDEDNNCLENEWTCEAVEKPDLIIEDIWTRERRDRCKVGFVVRNIGTVTAPCCHYATLFVNDEPVEEKHVRKALRPGRSYKGYFKTKVSCTDAIEVCADNFKVVDELDEDNNCREESSD